MTSAEYPGAFWIGAHRSNYTWAQRDGFSRIVAHCTDGHAVAQDTAAMWTQPGHKSSCHFVIGQDGTVVQSVSIYDIAWHAHHLVNATSVGIEHCARTPGELSRTDPGMRPSEIQLAASAKLCAWLLELAGKSADRTTIVGHAEADTETTHSLCPVGSGFDLDAYANRVRALSQGV